MLSSWLSWKAVCSTSQMTPRGEDVESSAGATSANMCSDVMDNDVDAIYWCVLRRLEDLKQLLPPSLDVCGLVTAPTTARPSLDVWLQFELRCGGERSHSSRARSLQCLLSQHFPASDGRTIIGAALRVLLDVSPLEQENRLCLLSLLQPLTARLTTPLSEPLLSFYNVNKSPFHHEHFVKLLQDVPPGAVVGGLSGNEVQELLLPVLQDMKANCPTTHLGSDVTSCLLSALLLVRSPPTVADSALNLLWHSVAFHWATVRWVFEEHLSESGGDKMAFPSLQELWRELRKLPQDDHVLERNDPLTVESISSLRPLLAVNFLLGTSLRHLRLHSNPSPQLPVRLFSGLFRKMYVKCLAAYLGEQIFNSRMTYFPDHKMESNSALPFQERLLKHCVEIFKEDTAEDVEYFLGCISSTSLDDIVESYCLFGFVFISLCCLESKDSASQTDLFKYHILHVLILCHCTFSEYSDKYNSLHEAVPEEPSAKKLKLSVESIDDYPLQLCQQIVRHLRTTGPSCLRLLMPVLPGNTDQGVKNLVEKICSQPSPSCR